jgi:hypothetical protein
LGSRRLSPASYQRSASNWLFGNNKPHPSFDLHHLGAVAVMFRTILICIALTMTAGAVQAANANLRGPLSQGAEAAAKAAIEACGYRNVKNLTRDPVGSWAAEAERGGVELAVVLQLNGEIAEE